MVDGVEWGTIFELEKAGDVFPTHVHDESSIHFTILAFGSIKCMGRPEIKDIVLTAEPGGTILNWKTGEAHGFTALTDGATLVNIRKNK